MAKKELFEQVQTTRTGDRVLRRRRKPRGIRHFISHCFRRMFRSSAGR